MDIPSFTLVLLTHFVCGLRRQADWLLLPLSKLWCNLFDVTSAV